MLNLDEQPARALPRRPIGTWTIYRGLLGREWLLHGRTLRGFFSAWLILLWILMLLGHPLAILIFGALFALVAGPALGGSDVAEGSEEFSFALPVTRGQYYVARLLIGLAGLVLFCGVGLAAVAFNWPQRLWALVVESGFTAPFPAGKRLYLYALAFLAPAAAFSCTFAFSLLSRSRRLAGSTWFVGALVVGAIGAGGLYGEAWAWGRVMPDGAMRLAEPNGWISCPALALAAVVGLAGSYVAYRRKEGISQPDGVGRSGLLWVWVVLGLGIVVGLMAVLWLRASTPALPVERPIPPPSAVPPAADVEKEK